MAMPLVMALVVFPTASKSDRICRAFFAGSTLTPSFRLTIRSTRSAFSGICVGTLISNSTQSTSLT